MEKVLVIKIGTYTQFTAPLDFPVHLLAKCRVVSLVFRDDRVQYNEEEKQDVEIQIVSSALVHPFVDDKKDTNPPNQPGQTNKSEVLF